MIYPIKHLQNWLNYHAGFKWLSFLPAIFWAGLIFWFSSQSVLPTLSTPWTEFLWKKTAHFLIFGGLYFWLWWSNIITQTKIKNSASQSSLFLILVFLYAISDEFHQSFVAFRHPSPVDVGIDLLGAICFCLSLWKYSAWPKKVIKFSKFLIPEQQY